MSTGLWEVRTLGTKARGWLESPVSTRQAGTELLWGQSALPTFGDQDARMFPGVPGGTLEKVAGLRSF